jgi:hypothetical protein
VQAVGRQLNLAIEKAAEGGSGTWHHKTAILIAEQAAIGLARWWTSTYGPRR